MVIRYPSSSRMDSKINLLKIYFIFIENFSISVVMTEKARADKF